MNQKLQIEGWVRKEVLDFKPYTPGEQPSLSAETIKLNTNENPYPPSPKIKECMDSIFETGLLRKYPNYHSVGLQTAISKEYNLTPDQILVTNGSDEALRLLFQAVVGPGDVVVSPDPSYSYYPVMTDQVMVGAKFQSIPLLPNYHFDMETLRRVQGKLLCFAHPNAPTGILEPKEEIKNLCKTFSGIVLCDEAYIDFSPNGSSLVDEIKNFPNLVVSRTFSKSYALAGLRVGYLMGNSDLIGLIRKLKDSYNVGILEQKIAEISFLDKEYFEEKRKLVIEERSSLKGELEALGFFVLPSETNFLFCKPNAGISPESIYQKLKERQILIRYFSTGISREFIRITVGTKTENERLLLEISNILKEKP
ncbi:MAG: histidinol-phosphate transaminase [Leptospira sp.]|nr:histidinol-phosphate transaminase [Leptospira sp.]